MRYEFVVSASAHSRRSSDHASPYSTTSSFWSSPLIAVCVRLERRPPETNAFPAFAAIANDGVASTARPERTAEPGTVSEIVSGVVMSKPGKCGIVTSTVSSSRRTTWWWPRPGCTTASQPNVSVSDPWRRVPRDSAVSPATSWFVAVESPAPT